MNPTWISLIQFLGTVIAFNVGAITITTVIMSGWVRSARLDKIEQKFDTEFGKTWLELSKVGVLSTKIENIETHISEIKEMIRGKGK